VIEPLLTLDSREKWRPVPVDGTLDRFGIRYIDGLMLQDGREVDRLDFPATMKPADFHHLPMVGYRREAHAAGLTWVQYWTWWPYNPKNYAGVGNHEGDWEMIQFGCASCKPVLASYARGGPATRCRDLPASVSRGLFFVVTSPRHAAHTTTGTRTTGKPPARKRTGEAAPSSNRTAPPPGTASPSSNASPGTAGRPLRRAGTSSSPASASPGRASSRSRTPGRWGTAPPRDAMAAWLMTTTRRGSWTRTPSRLPSVRRPRHPHDGYCVTCGCDDQPHARFTARHANRPVWVLRFQLDTQHVPRLLAASPSTESDYVTSPALALPDEPEALTTDDHARHVQRNASMTHAQWRALEHATRDAELEQLSLGRRLDRAIAEAAAEGRSISRDVNVIEKRLRAGSSKAGTGERLRSDDDDESGQPPVGRSTLPLDHEPLSKHTTSLERGGSGTITVLTWGKIHPGDRQ
jgi:hypothetical protein